MPAAWFDLALALIRTTPGFSRRRLAGGTDAALAMILRRLFVTTGAANQAAIAALESSLSGQGRTTRGRPRQHAEIEHGRDVARAIFAASRDDGGNEGYLRNFPADYTPAAGPGRWVPTPPGFQPALQPYWGRNRCLSIDGGAACPPGRPTRYSASPRSRFYAEAVEVYDAVTNLTAEQTEIARFWSDDPGITSTPPGHSVSIATQVLLTEDASLMTAAMTYAKVGMAVNDAFIACWNAKYRYDVLRPVT